MNLIKTSIERPIAVVSAVLMMVMFGIVALQTIPIQLVPDVNRPVITIRTIWPGAAPAEVEREITNRQEEVLKGIGDLKTIESRSEQGRSRITLEFDINARMDKALLLVSNRLDRVTGYPEEADEPSLRLARADSSAIAWFIITRQKGNNRPIYEYGDFIERTVQDRIERVAGVGEVSVYGGSKREIQIVVEPTVLARYRLTVSDIVTALRRANASISAGDVKEGKRRYVVRTQGDLSTLEQIKNVVLRSIRDENTARLARVTVGEIASVEFAYKDPTSNIRVLGEGAVAFNAKRETGANVIETMEGIKAAIKELNEGPIPRAGLRLRQVTDQTEYINASIDLVQENIWVGGALAAIILILFLRSFRATLIISVAIPVSVIGSFVAMAALGRSINVISLAGLAFAVGMVVDAAIVVLENIYRMREQGFSAREAAFKGASQVWGAVLVSALTTVMVFIPILVMKLEVGQLFRDIAVAISVSVLLSLIVSITVLPALASRLLLSTKPGAGDAVKRWSIPVVDHIARGFMAALLGFTRLVLKSKMLAIVVVVVSSLTAILMSWNYLPKLEYLPNGNRNLMFGVVIPPPGYNLKTMTQMAKRIETALKPNWITETGKEAVDGGPPKIKRFFFVASRANTILGAIAQDPSRTKELKAIVSAPIFREPGTFGIVNQSSLFGHGIGGGRKIELDIAGPELETILAVAGNAASKIFTILPRSKGHQFRPRPGLELGAPEVRVTPNRSRLADAGVSVRELGQSIDVFNEGMRVAEVTVGNLRIDMTLKGLDGNVKTTQDIGSLPVVTSRGQVLPASSLASIDLTSGPTEILHRERERTVILEVSIADDLPLETAVDMVKSEVIAKLEAEGLPPGVSLRIKGTAEKLKVTWELMQRDLLISLVIVFLVMAVLFESFIYPLIIMLSVPLAAAGGVGGLAAQNLLTAQPLDMLTVLGFVILVGIVVNNAILLLHQTLFHIREESMDPGDAILEATRNRVRPIFMSTLTSVFGMLPLVLFPGAGSELYRGLGSVVVGGLALSAILTLVIIPPMMSLIVGPIEKRTQQKKQALNAAPPAPAE
jgi:hydrophobic/amphiphilic exporter-1 (mainly G- bacteria), HAE1 family